MIEMSGSDLFRDNRFSYPDWSAPILETYDEVSRKIRELRLQGRVIKGFYSVGIGFNWREMEIGDAVYYALEERAKEQGVPLKGTFPFLPEDLLLHRFAEIDHPFLIEFEDGDVLAVDYSESSSVRMELNTIPKELAARSDEANFHPNVLFRDLLGKRIAAVEVTLSSEPDDATVQLNEQDMYITKLAFVCSDDVKREGGRLVFSSFYDYGHIWMEDAYGKDMYMPAPEVKEVVRGFIDEDVLNLQEDFQFD